jgi:mannose-6-phosphate isomerase-like protein (cupin superfamily)
MLHKFLSLYIILSANSLLGQQVLPINDMLPPADMQNIAVVPLDADSLHSSYIIWIDDTVRPHFHQTHTECVYILEGSGTFYRDTLRERIKAGDYFYITPKTVHSFKSDSGKRTKIISIQSPFFDGNDRIWVEKQPQKASKP